MKGCLGSFTAVWEKGANAWSHGGVKETGGSASPALRRGQRADCVAEVKMPQSMSKKKREYAKRNYDCGKRKKEGRWGM